MPPSRIQPAERANGFPSSLCALCIVMTLAVGCGDITEGPSVSASVSAPAPQPVAIDRAGPFCLTTEFGPIPADPGLMRYPLVRELGRQAMLIAARDGLGLATRDETLGEALPDGQDPSRAPLALRIRAFNAGNGSLILEDLPSDESTGSPAQEFGRFEFQFQSDTFNMYTALAAVLGEASRSELVDVLRDAGYRGKPMPSNADGSLPDGAESELAEMNFVSQFAAIQGIHQAMRESGESSARLGGLVRGYANLAMLTRHHWNSANAAFAARSLLYAERMMALGEDHRVAQLHRAYARALLGLHGMALQDLDSLPAVNQAAPNDPEWAGIIDPFCRFDEEELLELAEKSGLDQIVHQLLFELRSCYQIERWNVTAGPAALEKCPESYGINHTLADESPMLSQRQAVRNVAEAFGQQIPVRVRSLDELPKSVVELVSGTTGVNQSWISQWMTGDWNSHAGSPLPIQIATRLEQADPQPEPSWQILAALIRNEQFVGIADSLSVASNAVEYSKQDMVDGVMPLVEGHPYVPYVASYAIDRNREPEKFVELAGQITVRDPRANMRLLFYQFWAHSDAKGQHYCDLSTEALWQHDYCFPAMIASLKGVNSSWWKTPDLLSHFQRYVLDMKSISPHAPNTLRLEIQTTVDAKKKQLVAWEERGQSDPTALIALGKLHDGREDFELAIRCYDRAYEIAPDSSTAISLATAYREAGKEEHWLPALEDYLGREDYSLGHAVVHRHIAEDYMAKGKWKEAEPHALAAAGTWSGWGLVLAGRVCEGLGKWNESEKWFREAVQSYPSYCGFEWYFWCRRTGRGDVDAARKIFDEFLKLDWVQKRDNENYPLVDSMLSGKYQQALDEIQAREDYRADIYWQNHALLLAKHVNNDALYAELTDRLVKQINEQYQHSDPKLCEFYRIVDKLQQRGELSTGDIENVDKLVEKFGPISRTNYCYFLGEQLALHRDVENAGKYWLQSMSAGQLQKYNATFSGHRLAELHGTSRPDEIEKAAAEDEADKEAAENATENSL